MKTQVSTKTIKTTCGKTLTYFEKEGEVAKMHSTEGPAIIYPAEEKKAPEYYLYGIKYTRTRWQELITQHKALPIPDRFNTDYSYNM